MPTRLELDTWGLGYHSSGGQLYVIYPSRDDAGNQCYRGNGFPFDHRPEILRSPDSPRARLWTWMLTHDAESS